MMVCESFLLTFSEEPVVICARRSVLIAALAEVAFEIEFAIVFVPSFYAEGARRKVRNPAHPFTYYTPAQVLSGS